MSGTLDRSPHSIAPERLFRLALFIGILTVLASLAVYAYLGTFSRYTSDDYCLSAFFLRDELLNAMIKRYLNASNRYTNILFIGLADGLFGSDNVAILPALMLGLFVVGMYLFLKEISDALKLRWSRPLALFLALLFVYFSITQAPDLYQTLYWRAGMTSHFAPLVFMPFWGAFLIRQVRKAREQALSFWSQALCFVIPFVIGGLSEPPTALIITILFLALVVVWFWSDARSRRSLLILLSWSLAGAVTALAAMAMAPANALRLQTPPPGLVELISRVISYPLFFIVDSLRTLPVPTLLSIALPAAFFYVKYVYSDQSVSDQRRKHLVIAMLLILVLAYLFIAAGFAPSAYGQSYPVPRARFIGRVVMTAALMTEAALLGVLLATSGIQFFRSSFVRGVSTLMLLLLALYPLRAAWQAFGEIPVYQQSAAAWDARDAEIRQLKAQGVQDLVVRFLPEDPIQDLGDRAGFRLNRCAAALYGVNSIVAVPMEGK